MSDTKRYSNHCGEIGCDAEKCTFNEGGAVCTADHIKVDGATAKTTDETCCRTFIPRA